MVMECPGYSREFDPVGVFQKILVPIDFTPESRRALITACEARKQFGSEIHVFAQTRFEPSSALRGLGVVFGRKEAVDEARGRLDSFGQSICNGAHCLTANASFGEDVAQGIVDVVKESGATMVIMGLHQKHTLFRSRAEKIVRMLDVPVLLLPSETSQSIHDEVEATAAT